MQQNARAILLQVPHDADAYRMFETLNDRGLRTSQSDLVKNYLFGRSGNRIEEVQQRWSLMRGALETIEDEDITIRFLRHSLTLIQGFVREHEVYDAVQRLAKAAQPAVTFTGQLEALAHSYVAIYNADHEKWNRSDATRKAVEVLNLFDIRPLSPLILAIAERFDENETEIAMRFCVSFGVRLMIASSTRTGSVEEGLAEAAHEIYSQSITAASELKERLRHLTPSDGTFLAAFETAGSRTANWPDITCVQWSYRRQASENRGIFPMMIEVKSIWSMCFRRNQKEIGRRSQTTNSGCATNAWEIFVYSEPATIRLRRVGASQRSGPSMRTRPMN